MNLTYQTALVLEAIARGHHHGFEIMDVTGLSSGTTYPLLRRLDRAGIVSSRWEKPAVARREQRPPRRYYQLTSAGVALHARALERFHAIEQLVVEPSRKLAGSES